LVRGGGSAEVEAAAAAVVDGGGDNEIVDESSGIDTEWFGVIRSGTGASTKG
jgi:hypothetical protein